jgi:hypothetical protein
MISLKGITLETKEFFNGLLGGIKEAYPNYFADSTEFIKHYFLISSAPIPKGLFSAIFG